ncbi:hypothetical protein LXL04_006720 [Taraxacum kok-saghyz]
MASNNGVFQAPLLKLTGRNYHHWSTQMRVMFESQDLWNLVEEGYKELVQKVGTTPEQIRHDKENKKKDRKALFLIYQTVDENIFERISSSDTSKEAWDSLYKTYRGEDKVKAVRLQTLRCEFDGLKMKESETVEDFYNRVITTVNQMRLNGESLSDKRVVEKILRSLTRKFEYIVVAIEESKDILTLSLEILLGTLQSHELCPRQFDDTSSIEKAFHCRVTPKEDYVEGSSKGRDQRKPLSETQCFYCHKYGHTMKYCKKRKADEGEDANFICEKEAKEGETMLMAMEELDDA